MDDGNGARVERNLRIDSKIVYKRKKNFKKSRLLKRRGLKGMVKTENLSSWFRID